MSTVRIGTFNVENLFSRALILNKNNFDLTSHVLEQIALLERELAKDVYDINAIEHLYADVHDYVKFNVTSSQGRKSVATYDDKTKSVHVDVKGRSDWEGFMEPRRARFDDVTRQNTAAVIDAMKADILALIEVEDRLTMEQFDTEALGNTYAGAFSIQGNDNRGIDVGLYFKSGWTVVDVNTHIFEKSAERKSKLFSRDCLEVILADPKNTRLHFFINHFKSKSGRDQARNDARRLEQARRVAELVGAHDLDHEYIVVLGDLNDTPSSAPLAPLMAVPGLHQVFDASNPPTPASERWTYHYRSNEQIDHILISNALVSKLTKVEVERRGIADLAKFTNNAETSFPTVTSWRNAASDHAGIVATFDF